MNPPLELMLRVCAERFGWTLIHSLWQGAAAAALLAVALRLLRGRSAALRHALCLLALLAIAVSSAATVVRTWPMAAVPVRALPVRLAASQPTQLPPFGTQSPGIASVVTHTELTLPRAGVTPPAAWVSWHERLEHFLPWLSAFWLGGVALLSLRHAGGWRRVCALRRAGVAARPEIGRSWERLRLRFGLRPEAVRLLESLEAGGPMLVGLLRPAVLLPARCITGLSAAELEAVLAHELAHLVRRDSWSNLAQIVFETIFFYHPAVWWIGRRAREERECAADDLALRVCADRRLYAGALARLAEFQQTPATLALAAAGGSLLARIRRIVQPPPASAPAPAAWSLALPPALAAAALVFMTWGARVHAGEAKAITVEPGQSIQAAIDAAPDGAVIRLGAGEWKEKIIIIKPLTLEGAGWEKTRLSVEETPIEETRKLWPEFMAKRSAAKTPEEKRALGEVWIRTFACPAIWIHDASGVQLRGLRVQGISPLGPKDGSGESTLICLRRAKATVSDCAFVGPYANAIQLADASEADISGSLVAAFCLDGITVQGKTEGAGDSAGIAASRLHLADSEVRNIYHYGIRLGAGCDNTLIERCRISGTAWHGIRYDDASPAIIGNAIFAHARSGIYVSGDTRATIRANLFWKNEMDGVSCWGNCTDTIEGNTFVGNLREGLAALGTKPMLTHNIFASHPIAVVCGQTSLDRSGTLTSFGEPVLNGNLFWDNKTAIGKGKDALPTPADSLASDPRFRDAAKFDFALAADSPLRAAKVGAADPLAPVGPWPLLAEEKSIIPAGDTRDFALWKAPAEKPPAPAESTRNAPAGSGSPAPAAEKTEPSHAAEFALKVLSTSEDPELRRSSLEVLGESGAKEQIVPLKELIAKQPETAADFRRTLEETVAKIEARAAKAGGTAAEAELVEREKARIAQLVEVNRRAARVRASADRRFYSPEQLDEIETLYQVANNKGLHNTDARASLRQLLDKYDKANRTGCATLYYGQGSVGAERVEYLTRAVEKFSDCYYFNGCQVGGYGRVVLAETLWENGEKDKARALVAELKTTYKDATDHHQRPMSEVAAELEKEFAAQP